MTNSVGLPLSERARAQRADVHRVSDWDPERLPDREELGMRPGVAITVPGVLPFDGPLGLKVDGVEHVVGRPIAAVGGRLITPSFPGSYARRLGQHTARFGRQHGSAVKCSHGGHGVLFLTKSFDLDRLLTPAREALAQRLP